MRLRPATAVAVAVALVVPAAALAAPDPGPSVQQVSGTVLVPNPTKAAQNVTRPGRSAGLAAAQAQGALGWWILVDRATWGGQFVLGTATAGADMDITFYSDPGTLADAPTASGEFLGADGDGERGIVPAGSTHALVQAAAAPNAAFTYVGHAPVEVQIGAGSLDVSVPVGGSVTWVNKSGDYTFVDGGRTFSSGTGTGSGIPVGKTFTATLGKVGKYTYTTSVGTGTVTVTA